MRANFDYEPEEDPYLPCQQMGIKFARGDVLRVVSDEDANWWQAYREGDDEQQLPGLIPSPEFHQRKTILLRKYAFDQANELTKRSKSRTLPLLCFKKCLARRHSITFNDPACMLALLPWWPFFFRAHPLRPYYTHTHTRLYIQTHMLEYLQRVCLFACCSPKELPPSSIYLPV